MKKWRMAIRQRGGGWFSFMVEGKTRAEAWKKGWERIDQEGGCYGEAIMGPLL